MRWRFSTSLLALLVLGWVSATAEPRKLQLRLMGLNNDALSGIVIAPEGQGGSSFPTNADGRTSVVLPDETKPNDSVKLELLRPRQTYVFISPFDHTVSVPSFENRPDNFRLVVLAKPGDKAILQTGAGIVAITARILAADDPELQRKSKTPEEMALLRVAQEFGLSKEDIDAAIRSWKQRSKDGSEGEALIALYEKRYPKAAELFAASLKSSERELADAKRNVFRDAYFLGVSTFKQKQFAQAAAAFNRAVEVDPLDYSALDYLASSLTEAHEYGRAVGIYEKLLSVIDGDDDRIPETLLPLANALEHDGKDAKARTILERAYDLTKNDDGEPQEYAEYLYALAEFLERHGEFDAAADYYQIMFMGYYHPREFPRIDGYTLGKIIDIRRKQGKSTSPADVTDFVLEGDGASDESRNNLIDVVRSLESEK
jgi:tetratricopeptide (TPR) repeat protein